MADREYKTAVAKLRVSACRYCPAHFATYSPKATAKGFTNQLHGYYCNARREFVKTITGIDENCRLPLWEAQNGKNN